MDHIEGKDLPRYLEGFAGMLAALAEEAVDHEDRAVELAARDASDALLVLLDVLAMPADDE